ncbi:MAG: DUF3046 domain-containing protein, partial [Candidatus Nanopelagicales bacterium]
HCARPGGFIARVRMTEFWQRMERALGPGYAQYWADNHVLAQLDGRTASQALAQGTGAKTVWRAVWQELGLSPRDR